MGRWIDDANSEYGHPTASAFFLEYLEQGMTINQARKKIGGVSKAAAFDWLDNPEFLQRVARAVLRIE